MRRPAMLACLVLAAAGTGCSTHRPDLETNAPERVQRDTRSPGEVGRASTALFNEVKKDLDQLPADAIAPLGSAASLNFRATGAVSMRGAAQELGRALLGARAKRGDVTGFYGQYTAGGPGAQITAVSAETLLDLTQHTRSSEYLEPLRESLRAITSPELGWRRVGPGFGVSRSGSRRVNVALTAHAASVIRRSGRVLGQETDARAEAALRTVLSAQAAVGRWYSDVDGRTPMSLSEWATTLRALITWGDPETRGVAGGGVDGLWAAAFEDDGTVRQSALTDRPIGVALALQLLAEYPDQTYADKAFERLLASRRGDGTVTLAAPDDHVAQAYFALALAQRHLQLKRAGDAAQ